MRAPMTMRPLNTGEFMDEIELRWLRRFIPPGLVEHSEDGTRYLVLQFRKREGPRGEDWWGEWRDVPLAEE
jgi:hypothetical protein